MTYAKVIADSNSPAGSRLTTFEVELHRFVLAELNTHRQFSRNSASSRAIPVKKQIARILQDPALPLSWASEKPGMQGGGELGKYDKEQAIHEWLSARDSAVATAYRLMDTGLHKSLINRILEPFMWHRVIITTTEAGLWNFFQLRCSPLAQPEIRVAAEMMQEAYRLSAPRKLDMGEWHTPYIVADEDEEFAAHQKRPMHETINMLSVARCCRVSYLTHDQRREPGEDIALYEKLVSATPMHASPLEHVATPCGPSGQIAHFGYHWGNLEGWDSLRHVVEGVTKWRV